MSQAAFAALFLTNATAARAGIRRHKKARVAGLLFFWCFIFSVLL